jgi:hypothetical protein
VNVRYHNIWKKQQDVNCLYSICAYSGVSLFVKETSPYAVLVVTDVMRRAQMLPSSKEMIFIDSSSSCDSTQATVTTLLTVTKAGAVPIGVVIHESQSTAGYTDAFAMLTEHFPKCFGGEKVICFEFTVNTLILNTYNFSGIL